MAQQYPSRTVTIVVPYPAGGPTDETARHVANFLSKKFGQSFIVENITGGSTIVATNKVAKATPDGYTLLLHNLQITANVTLFKNMPFDTDEGHHAGDAGQQEPADSSWVGRACRRTISRN